MWDWFGEETWSLNMKESKKYFSGNVSSSCTNVSLCQRNKNSHIFGIQLLSRSICSTYSLNLVFQILVCGRLEFCRNISAKARIIRRICTEALWTGEKFSTLKSSGKECLWVQQCLGLRKLGSAFSTLA